CHSYQIQKTSERLRFLELGISAFGVGERMRAGFPRMLCSAFALAPARHCVQPYGLALSLRSNVTGETPFLHRAAPREKPAPQIVQTFFGSGFTSHRI